MWKLLPLIIYTINLCWAGPLILKKNHHQQHQEHPQHQQHQQHYDEDTSLKENLEVTVNDMKMYENGDEKIDDFSSGMSLMHTLNLPSNASSIRANIIDGFSCQNRSYGYYADIENECQIFHVCLPVKYANGKESVFRWSFICPEETVFSQDSFICMRPEDMTITCKESYQYYVLNRNFGIIDGVMDTDPILIPNLDETVQVVEQNKEKESAPIDEGEEQIQNAPVRPLLHKPNRPKPSASFTYMHNRPKVSSYPLRKIPAATQAAEIIPEDLKAASAQTPEIEEGGIKPLIQKYPKRPLLNITKVKSSSVKPALEPASHSKRKRPGSFNNKKLITTETPLAVVDEKKDAAKIDANKQNFFVSESSESSESGINLQAESDMPDPGLVTKLADTESQPSEQKIIFIRPTEGIKVTDADDGIIEPVREKAEESIGNMQETESENENERLSETPIPELIQESISESTSESISESIPESIPESINQEASEAENEAEIEASHIPTDIIMGSSEIDEDSKVPIAQKQSNESPETVSDLIVTPVKAEVTNSNEGNELEPDKNVEGSIKSDESLEESIADNGQLVEEMEAEKPVGAPETMPATDEMLEQPAAVQEVFGNLKPANSEEAEKLIVNFINKMRIAEENRPVLTLESTEANRPDASDSVNSKESIVHEESEAEEPDTTTLELKNESEPSLIIENERTPETDREIQPASDETPLPLESANENQNEAMNLSKLFPFNEPQIIEEHIPDEGVAIHADNERNVNEAHDKSLPNLVSFDDVVEMVKEHLDHVPSALKQDHPVQDDADKALEEAPKMVEENPEGPIQSNSDPITDKDLYVPIYNRIVHNNEENLNEKPLVEALLHQGPDPNRNDAVES